MITEFIAHPQAKTRVGDYLLAGLTDPKWTEFHAVVAFVKRSGTKHICGALETFSKNGGKATITAGIDVGGTSAEGLADLMTAVGSSGTVFVYRNTAPSTFHPKIYLFQNKDTAEIVVGSVNLTEGGLYTNYEASVIHKIDLKNSSQKSFFDEVVFSLTEWSTPKDGLCYALNDELLADLFESGLVPNEKQSRERVSSEATPTKSGSPSLFAWHSVPTAPKLTSTKESKAIKEEEPEDPDEGEGLEVPELTPVPSQGGQYTSFAITLQRTDVGVGQTTKGTSRRSPEIFIPLKARDYDPEFWGWPDLFEADAGYTGDVDQHGRGKMDRNAVMFRIGGNVVPVNMFYNPVKRDLRLRSEHLRSAGTIGDILYLERSNGAGGFAYYADVVPQGSPRHAELLALCVEPVRNSPKIFGYF